MDKDYCNIEMQRDFRLHDKVTMFTYNESYFGKIISLSVGGLIIEQDEDDSQFIEWKEIKNTCGHGY